MDRTVRDGILNRVHAYFYDAAMETLENTELSRRRRHLLGNLSGRILEVGSGTGVNFPLYGRSAMVIGCEPSLPMYEKAQAVLSAHKFAADIHLVNSGIEGELIHKLCPTGSFDAVVCTLVLCSVEDPEELLRNIRAWLKPGGKLVVLEHIKAGFPLHLLQSAATPVWRVCTEGCHLDRPTDKIIREAGFKPLKEEYFHLVMPWYMAELEVQ